eukprot:Tbor_TRINITY_DN3130_c0_g1::TRINITY_DN3130_c0_g1_i1::g.14704::m.14704
MKEIFDKSIDMKECPLNCDILTSGDNAYPTDNEDIESHIEECESKVDEVEVETQEERLQRQLAELERFGFSRPDDPEEDSTGRMSYIAACKRLDGGKDVIISLPVETVVEKFEMENVVLDHAGLGDRGTQALAEALKINQIITSLSLANNFITSIGAEYLISSLYHNNTITVLDLSDNQLGRHVSASPLGGIGSILKPLLSKSSNLLELSLRGNKIGDIDIEYICEGLMDNHSLQKLDISYNNVRFRGADAIAKMLQNNYELVDLNLGWNQLCATGCSVILNDGLTNNNNMKRFNISWNGLDDSSGTVLGRIIRESNIEEIDLSHNRLGPTGAAAIAAGIAGTSTLTSLNLDDNPLQDSGCTAIVASLKGNDTVKCVRLLHTRCGKAAIREASEVLRLRHSLEIIVPEMAALV